MRSATQRRLFALSRAHGRGMTLVELIMAVVIISIAVTGVILAYVQSVKHSADPMVDAQSLAVAEAYMDEILAKPVGGSSGCTAGSPRMSCAVIADYNALSEAPTNQFGDPISELAGYAVNVSVGGSELGIGDATIQVTVTHTASGRAITLRSHKVDY